MSTITPGAIKTLTSLLNYLQANKNDLVIDGDTHPTRLSRLEGETLKRYASTRNYYHGRALSPEELLMEMDETRVDMALTWQNPATIEYSDDQNDNFRKLLLANRDIYSNTIEFPNRFIPGGWTDPKALGLDNALRLVDICVKEFGFPIVKLNPAQNQYHVDAPEVFAIVRRIIELGATPAVHYGGDTVYTPASGLERLAEIKPDHPLIGVHMGGGGSHYVEGEQLYIDSRELGLRRPNIFFILSAKRDCHIESDLIEYALAGEPFVHNLACGSDAPYGKVTWNFGGFEKMFQHLTKGTSHTDKRLHANPELFTQEIVQGFMGRNLAELVIASCQRVLRTANVQAAGRLPIL